MKHIINISEKYVFLQKRTTCLILIFISIFMNSLAQINGYVKPGFEPVYNEFKKNFDNKKESGAALCVYHKGEKVIDLWAGIANKKIKSVWDEKTLVLFFSATKGVASLCIAKLHSEGKIDYDKPVATYWKNFAKNGKENITVRQLLSHQSGLCHWDGTLTVSELADREKLVEKLENASPYWTQGEYSGYSAALAGHYMSELIRRIDTKHRSLGQYFQDEFARPLGIEFYIGLPDSIGDERMARIEMNNPLKRLFMLDKSPKGLIKQMMKPSSLFFKSMTLVKGYNVNERETWRIEEPSGNGIGTVESLAKLYSVFSLGAKEFGIREETLNECAGTALHPTTSNVDKVMGIPLYYRNGFMKNGEGSTPFPNDACYGFGGASGSMAFADPVNQVGYCYVPNKMGYDFPDSREVNIQKVLYKCIENLK
jgi:CubicO group peptidase (beta-lactamase class C family)